jgi:hypothetical protein
MQIKNFNYSESKIDTFVTDSYNRNYLWLGFEKNGSYCTLQKVSANNPYQIYFNIDVEIDEWKKFFIYSTYLYTAVSDDIYIGKRYALSTPLTSTNNFTKPIDANEDPVDIQVTSTYVFFLLPGILSGETAKIYKFTLTGTYVETIELSTVENISSFVAIDNTNLWAITNASPTELIRIYNDGSWHYTAS